jgi:hypothetical protein
MSPLLLREWGLSESGLGGRDSQTPTTLIQEFHA